MQPVAADLVPEYDEREAARFNGYTWKEWLEFDILDAYGRYNRAAGIAYHRVHQMIEAHKDDALNQEMERKTKRPHG